jgi:sugar O-acyltransferase (sialic acid O-acetyltransferase NeuD family)
MATTRAKRSTGRPLLVLVGGGGHGIVVAEAAKASGWRLGGFLDDNPDAIVRDAGLRSLGGLLDNPARHAKARRIVCLGDLALRRRTVDSLVRHASWGTVVHPAAYVSPSATIGRGVFVAPGAVVHSFAVIGDHAIINSGAIVEHHCVIGENTHVAPGAVVAGACTVGRDTLVGVGARLIPKVRVGDGVVVGAGAVVIGDVPGGARVLGVPARSQDGR